MNDRAVQFTWKISPGNVSGADGLPIPDIKEGQTTELLESHASRYQLLGYGSIGTKAVGKPYEIVNQEGLDVMLRDVASRIPEESKPVRGPINVARGGRLV